MIRMTERAPCQQRTWRHWALGTKRKALGHPEVMAKALIADRPALVTAPCMATPKAAEG